MTQSPHIPDRWIFRGILRRITPVWLTALAVLSGSSAWAVDSRKVEEMIEDSLPAKQQALSAEQRQKVLASGEQLYRKFCIHCHGTQGEGNGKAAPYLAPRPRDLRSGIFKFHSTQSNALPVDADLIHTLREGVPGTAMPAWGNVLNSDQIQALVAYLKTFSGRFEKEIPDYRIRIGLELPYDPLSVRQGKQVYRQMRCGRCHGENGEKSGPLDKSMDDIWGHTSFVYDLRRPELYKAGASSRAIYQTLVGGMDGTPMNAYDYLSEDERWHLVHYLQSLFVQAQPHQTSETMKVDSVRSGKPLTEDPMDPVWNSIPAVQVALQPVRFRSHPIQSLQVQSAYHGNRIAIRLQWEDASPETASNGPARFLDEVAIQFPLNPATVADSPFFGMGESRKPVNLWHWKAWQKASAISTDLPSIESYVNPFTESPVEELNSSGFGSLTVQPLQNQHVSGHGYWVNGQWVVVFVRDLSTYPKTDVEFSPGISTPLAFAIWDGASKDKNASKVVSFWHLLRLKEK